MTNNTIPKADGASDIVDSNITDNGTTPEYSGNPIVLSVVAPSTIIHKSATGAYTLFGIDANGYPYMQSALAGWKIGFTSSGVVEITGPAVFAGGTVTMSGLPTANPHVVNELWSNAGVVTVSAG